MEVLNPCRRVVYGDKGIPICGIVERALRPMDNALPKNASKIRKTTRMKGSV